MVQMIPSTYRMVRSWHPNVPLMPDFVEGMRNHVNATQAMLLYMQRTWNDLMASPTVSGALSSGIATQEQLMAAGYNSNPARLAGHRISFGGDPDHVKRERQLPGRLGLFQKLPVNPFAGAEHQANVSHARPALTSYKINPSGRL